jgi:hypothetical protein
MLRLGQEVTSNNITKACFCLTGLDPSVII